MRIKNERLKINAASHPMSKILPIMIRKAKDIAERSLDYECKDLARHDFRMVRTDAVKFKFGREYEEFNILPFATLQLCHKLGMPYKFFNKLDNMGYDMSQLLLDTMNGLARRYKGQLLLRTVDSHIRGVLTPKYRTFDTNELLDVFSCASSNINFLERDSLVVRGLYQGLDLFHMRFTSSEKAKCLQDKDLYFGMQLTSSDVGRSSIRLDFFVFKRICTNGLCLKLLDNCLYDQRHIGVTKDDVYLGLSAAFDSFPRLVNLATDLINRGSQASIVESGILASSESQAAKKQREQMKRYLAVGDEDLDALARITIRNYEPTVWGYVNAITEYSQRFDVIRRMDLENKAGKLLSKEGMQYFVG